MIAVIELGGNQFTVKQGDVIDVKKLPYQIDEEFGVQPLLVSDEEGADSKIGTPFVDDSEIKCRVISHFKGKKIRVFKMHAKKRYMKNIGFKPSLTQIEILSI